MTTMDNNLTDNEIVKALECCSKKICKQCPNFSEDIECSEKLINLTLDYIARQLHELQERYEEVQTEIEKLNAENMLTISERNAFRTSFYDVLKQLKITKSEAVKEFAERLKEHINNCHSVSDEGEYVCYDCACANVTNCIDNLVKEMVGDDNVSAL